MKKIIYLLLVSALLFSLFSACGDTSKETSETTHANSISSDTNSISLDDNSNISTDSSLNNLENFIDSSESFYVESDTNNSLNDRLESLNDFLSFDNYVIGNPKGITGFYYTPAGRIDFAGILENPITSEIHYCPLPLNAMPSLIGNIYPFISSNDSIILFYNGDILKNNDIDWQLAQSYNQNSENLSDILVHLDNGKVSTTYAQEILNTIKSYDKPEIVTPTEAINAIINHEKLENFNLSSEYLNNFIYYGEDTYQYLIVKSLKYDTNNELYYTIELRSPSYHNGYFYDVYLNSGLVVKYQYLDKINAITNHEIAETTLPINDYNEKLNNLIKDIQLQNYTIGTLYGNFGLSEKTYLPTFKDDISGRNYMLATHHSPYLLRESPYIEKLSPEGHSVILFYTDELSNNSILLENWQTVLLIDEETSTEQIIADANKEIESLIKILESNKLSVITPIDGMDRIIPIFNFESLELKEVNGSNYYLNDDYLITCTLLHSNTYNDQHSLYYIVDIYDSSYQLLKSYTVDLLNGDVKLRT